jgi:hypothetical protein
MNVLNSKENSTMKLTKNGVGRLTMAALIALGLGASAGACHRSAPPAATPAAGASNLAVPPPSVHHSVKSLAEGNGPIAPPSKLWSRAAMREISRSRGVVFHVVADAEAVYSALENGEIRRASKAGGPSTVLTTAPSRDSIYFLAQDDEALYYSRPVGLYRLPKMGGAPQTLVEDTTPDPASREQLRPQIAVDAKFVYFATMKSDGALSLDRVAKTGGPRTVLAHLGGDVQALAVDEDSLYWASLDPVKAGFEMFIRSMPKRGGPSKELARREGFATSAAVLLVGDDVVWADAGLLGRVASVPKRGGKTRILATSERGVAPYLAYDGRSLFWAEGYSRELDGQQWGLVMSVAPTGGASVAVTSTLKQIGGLTADRGGVYVGEGFSSPVGAQIWSVPAA